MSKFTDWLNRELESRGWSYNELGRRAGLSSGGVSVVMTERQKPGYEFCFKVAHALQELPENVLYLAGLLSSLPPEVAEEKEIVRLLRRMPSDRRRVVLDMLRGVAGQPSPSNLPRSRGSMIQDLPEMLLVPEEAMERALDWWSEVLHSAPDVAQPVLARLLYLAAEWYGHDQDVKQLIEDILRDNNIADGVKKKMIKAMQESRRGE